MYLNKHWKDIETELRRELNYIYTADSKISEIRMCFNYTMDYNRNKFYNSEKDLIYVFGY